MWCISNNSCKKTFFIKNNLLQRRWLLTASACFKTYFYLFITYELSGYLPSGYTTVLLYYQLYKYGRSPPFVSFLKLFIFENQARCFYCGVVSHTGKCFICIQYYIYIIKSIMYMVYSIGKDREQNMS